VAILALMGIGVGAFAFSGTPGGTAEPLPLIKRPAKAAAPTASLAAWRQKANRICAEADQEAAAIGTPQTREQLLAYLPVSLDGADAALVELRAAPGPKRRQQEIGRMLGLFTKFIAVERQALTALQAGDTLGFAKLTGRAFVLNDRGNRVARSLGADRCAEDGTDTTTLAKAQRKHRIVVAILYAPDANVDTLAIREARSGAADANAGFVAINVYDPREIAAVTVAYTLRSTPSVLVYERGEGAVNIFEGYVDGETVAQAADNAAL